MSQKKSSLGSTDLVEVFIINKEILYVKILDKKAQFDLEEAKKQYELIFNLTDGKDFLALIDTRDSFSVPTIEAKKFLAQVDKKIAEAILVNSLGNRILGNIYLKFINNRYPSKIFQDEEKAIKWLLSYKK